CRRLAGDIGRHPVQDGAEADGGGLLGHGRQPNDPPGHHPQGPWSWDDAGMKMLLAVLANAVALWVAAVLLPGISFGGEGTSLVLTVVLVAALFGVLNAIVKPLLKLLAMPFIVLTLGL